MIFKALIIMEKRKNGAALYNQFLQEYIEYTYLLQEVECVIAMDHPLHLRMLKGGIGIGML